MNAINSHEVYRLRVVLFSDTGVDRLLGEEE